MTRRARLLVAGSWAILGIAGQGALGASGDEAERTAATESLRATELAFAAALADGDREGFAAMIEEEAIFVTGAVRRGKAAIVEAWGGYFAEGAPELVWHPETVEVQESGALGFTRGPYTLTITDAEGGVSTQTGTFMSIWRRQDDGSWRIVFDSGCPCP